MYKTMVSAWVPVSLRQRLERIASEHNVTLSQLIGDVLAGFTDGKSIQLVPHTLWNRDGKQDEALRIIEEHKNESVSRLKQRLADAGIKRSENWISKKRLPMRAKGATHTSG